MSTALDHPDGLDRQHRGDAAFSVYGASKAAVQGLARHGTPDLKARRIQLWRFGVSKAARG